MSKIFISHSAKDKPVSDNLSDLLIKGCDLTNEDVFCDSIENAGLMIGSDFITWIKDRLKESDIIIQLVTPNYLESKLCMAEMGAAWALDNEIFPFLHPDIDRELSFIFLGKHTARLNEIGLDNLKHYISDHIKKTDQKNDTWSDNKNDFLDKLPELLKSLPAPEEYSAEEYNKTHQEKEAVNNLYQREQKKNDELKSVIEDLKRAIKAEEAKVARLQESARKETDEKSEVVVSKEVKSSKAEISKDEETKVSPDHEARDKPEADILEIIEDKKKDKIKETDPKDSPDHEAEDEPVKDVEKSKDKKSEEDNDTKKNTPPDEDAHEEPVKEVPDKSNGDESDKDGGTEIKDSPDHEAEDEPVKDVSEESKDKKSEDDIDTKKITPPDEDAHEETVKEVAEGKKDIKEDEAEDTEKKDPPDREIYEKLVKDVYNELDGFGKAVKRCLYAYFSGEDWVPGSNILKWHSADIDKAKRRVYIEEGDIKGSFTINYVHPTISPVVEKIKKLDKFLKEDISPDLAKYLQDERYITFSIKNKEYWESELLAETLID